MSNQSLIQKLWFCTRTSGLVTKLVHFPKTVMFRQKVDQQCLHLEFLGVRFCLLCICFFFSADTDWPCNTSQSCSISSKSSIWPKWSCWVPKSHWAVKSASLEFWRNWANSSQCAIQFFMKLQRQLVIRNWKCLVSQNIKSNVRWVVTA